MCVSLMKEITDLEIMRNTGLLPGLVTCVTPVSQIRSPASASRVLDFCACLPRVLNRVSWGILCLPPVCFKQSFLGCRLYWVQISKFLVFLISIVMVMVWSLYLSLFETFAPLQAIKCSQFDHFHQILVCVSTLGFSWAEYLVMSLATVWS